MGVKVRDAPGAAGVECPKKTGEMDKNAPCTECGYWLRCAGAIIGAMGVEGQ